MSCNTHCQFCMEFSGSSDAIYFQLASEGPTDRTIFRDSWFRVIPPLGQFVEGSVMLISESHVPSCDRLPAEGCAALENLMSRTEIVLARAYSSPVFFEHGPAPGGGKGTCCVDHAHIHAFPVNVDVHKFLASRFPFTEISKLAELRDAVGNGGYLFLQQQARRFVYRCEVVPSQLVRQVISRELGVPERWHWRDYLGLKEMRSTWSRLRKERWDEP